MSFVAKKKTFACGNFEVKGSAVPHCVPSTFAGEKNARLFRMPLALKVNF